MTLEKTENALNEPSSPNTRNEKTKTDPSKSTKSPEEIYGIESDEHYAG